MSGEKEVRLRESEYSRIMQAARQVETQQSQARALEAQLQQTQRRIQEQQRAADLRQQVFNKTIGTLSEELQASTRGFQDRLARQQQEHARTAQRLEKDISQRLKNQQQQFSRSIGELDQRLAGQGEEFSRRAQQLDQTVEKQRQEYLGLIAEQANDVQKQFASIARQQRNAQEHAEQWLADTRSILDYMERHQRHQQHAPGALADLKNEFAISQRNIQDGHYEAAIAGGQALYGKALKLRAEIEFRQMEWETYYTEALIGVRAQLAALAVQESARWTFDSEEGSKELDAEIDYWSDGALTALKTRIEESLASLENASPPLSLDELKQRIQSNQTYQDELVAIITRAKEKLISSQLRALIALDLVNELANSGWQLDDATWQGEGADGKGFKNSYHLKLSDQGQNEMITLILPEETPQGQIENRVQFAYYPLDNNDSRFAANQTARLNDTLVRLGLTQERLQCVPGHERTIRGDASRRDFEKIRMTPPTPTRGKPQG